ncbi:MAG TPA: discoidin domain-containing protein, partial [Umezawaea sp.]|nr:discoidin domain-containing protein [Umezawaea sp.]
MVSRSFSAALAGALVALTLVVSPASAAQATTLHVSPGGGGAKCSDRSPCSLAQARKKVRELAPTMRGDIVVSLEGGTYALDAPLTFTAADSGTHGHRVRWQAAGGRTPVLSGGVPISGWTRGSGNLWSAKAPADLRTRQLYADGGRLTRASGTAPVGLTQTATGYTVADASMASWRNPGALEFVFADGHGSWSEPRCAVAGISGTAITMRQPCWDNLDLPDGPRGPYGDNPHGGFPTFPTDARPSLVENAFELISDGEWYLDDTTHVLYYQAKQGEDPRRMRFTAAKLDGLLRTTTTADAPLHDVTFQGLEFAHSTWLRPASDEGFVEMQANFTITGVGGSKSQGLCEYSEPKGTCPFASWTRPDAAVDLTGTKNVEFLDNTFQHLGGAGLGFQHGVVGNVVRGNTFTDISGIGLLLGSVDDPLAEGDAFTTGNTVDNNRLHRTGVEFTGAPAIVAGYTRGTTITHNEISDVPYSGISAGWGGWRTNSTFPDENPNNNGDNDISYNLVYRDMLVRYDGGAVYTSGPQGRSYEHGLTVRGNVNFSGAKTANMIYNDEGGDYVTITGNVQYNDTGGFNGGCSTTGHLRRKDNYRVGTLNSFGCAPAPVGNEDLGGNRLIGQNPQAGEVPNAVFAAAGLQGKYRELTTRSAPVVALASPTCTDDILVSGSGFTPQAKVTIAGRAVRPVFVSSNHLTVKLPKNSAGGAVSVTTKAGTSAVDVDATTTLCRGLSTTSSNVGVTSDGNTGPGNVDGFGYTYSAEALATKGVVPGGPVRWNGITYTWPTASPGTPNNTLAAGQTVGLIGSSPTLGFLLTSTYATSGKGTVNYTDGTTLDYTVGAPNWAEAPPDGVTPVITTPYRNAPNNGRDNRNVYVFAAEVRLDPTKTVKSVKLPVVGSEVGVDVPALHIFAMALAGSPNLALGKPAVASSEAYGGAAARVVDGDTNGVFGNNSVSHTDEDRNAWWQVDLGASAPISAINVWNRTDCCTARLDDHWTFVSEQPFDTSLTPERQAAKPGVWSSHHTGPAPVVNVEKPGVSGRYVMVQLSKKDYLTLAEVEVYGGKPASDGDWVGTWGTAQAAPIVGSQGWFTNETIRSVVHTSVGGTAARVRFSNKFGTGPLVLDHTSIALRANGENADAVEGSVRPLTFS